MNFKRVCSGFEFSAGGAYFVYRVNCEAGNKDKLNYYGEPGSTTVADNCEMLNQQ